MNKSEIIDAIVARGEFTKTVVSKVVDAFIDVVGDRLAGGNKVALPGLGIFSLLHREARTGRNPATGEQIKIGASNAVKFAAALPLKAKVNAPQRKVGGQRISPLPARKSA